MKIFGYDVSFKRQPAPTRKREFAAAGLKNTLNDFKTELVDLNYDIQAGLRNIRARTRDRAKNSCWFRRYIESSQRNLIGPNGLRLNMRIRNPDGNLDRIANDIIETAWLDWSKTENASAAGNQSWYDLQLLAVQTWKTDGEFMFQKVRGKQAGKYLFRLAPIDPALCDVDYNMPMNNGREIVQGVERDAFGRATAFYFRDHVDLLGRYGGNLRRIPASEIIHGYWVEGPGQVRGFPDAVGALISLHMLDKVSEAEVTAVRLAACKMGFYQNEAGTGVAVLGDSKEGADLVSEAEPGVFQILPNGVNFKDFDPKHPTANYRDFVKTQLREVAAGLRLSYNDFANDLEGVNFSSIRGGVLAERDSWMVQQGWLVEHLCRPVFAAWLEMFLLSGQSMLPMSKYDKFHADTWIPRRWQWVDPLKDAEANKVMREQGWKSDQQIVSEQGNDLDEVLEQIESDQETKKELGIASPPPAAPQLTPAPNDKDGEE